MTRWLGDFELLQDRHREAIAKNAAEWPFNLMVDGIFVTRARAGGDYIAYVCGQECLAIADGSTGLDDYGFFHFSLEDNPLG